MTVKKFTNKQLAFMREYMIDNNGARSARVAGYSPSTANREANRLLSHVDIINELNKRREAKARKLDITFDNKYDMLWNMAQEAYSVGDYAASKGCIAEMNKMTGDIAPTKTENKTEVTMNDVYESIAHRPESSPKNAIRH